jgi:hypothetical protein
MKQFRFAWLVIVMHPLLAQGETEVWYDWRGMALGSLPAESQQKIQASDLVKDDATLIRAEPSPWAQREWRTSYDVGWYGNGLRWHGIRSCASPSLRCRSVTTPWCGFRYNRSDGWQIRIQQPGFSLIWRR